MAISGSSLFYEADEQNKSKDAKKTSNWEAAKKVLKNVFEKESVGSLTFTAGMETSRCIKRKRFTINMSEL